MKVVYAVWYMYQCTSNIYRVSRTIGRNCDQEMLLESQIIPLKLGLKKIKLDQEKSDYTKLQTKLGQINRGRLQLNFNVISNYESCFTTYVI